MRGARPFGSVFAPVAPLEPLVRGAGAVVGGCRLVWGAGGEVGVPVSLLTAGGDEGAAFVAAGPALGPKRRGGNGSEGGGEAGSAGAAAGAGSAEGAGVGDAVPNASPEDGTVRSVRAGSVAGLFSASLRVEGEVRSEAGSGSER